MSTIVNYFVISWEKAEFFFQKELDKQCYETRHLKIFLLLFLYYH